jgi:hypothetical protein
MKYKRPFYVSEANGSFCTYLLFFLSLVMKEETKEERSALLERSDRSCGPSFFFMDSLHSVKGHSFLLGVFCFLGGKEGLYRYFVEDDVSLYPNLRSTGDKRPKASILYKKLVG